MSQYSLSAVLLTITHARDSRGVGAAGVLVTEAAATEAFADDLEEPM